MRVLGVMATGCGVGASAGLTVGGLASLVGGAVDSAPFAVWLVLVGSIAGAFVGAASGIAGAAVLLLADRAQMAAYLVWIATALSAATTGAAVAAVSFGSYLADPIPVICAIFAITALATGLGLPASRGVSRASDRRRALQSSI